jgi:hypothetical protein
MHAPAGKNNYIQILQQIGVVKTGYPKVFTFSKLFNAFQDKTLRHMNTNRCLATQPSDPNIPKLVECNSNSSYQQWIMSSKFRWQAS